jgi:predicted aspartyl protease
VFDFLLDTGANVNSIDAQVAERLDLPLVEKTSEHLSLVGSTGSGFKHAGDLYRLGDCELNGLPQNVTFMTNLTAAALPYASPVGVGLLSLAFLYSFPAGVEVDWHGTDGDPPTIIFYFGKELPQDVISKSTINMTRVPLRPLVGGVLTLTIHVNGVEMPALLDTGSPITVISREAAKLVGIELVAEKSKVLKITGVGGGQMDLQPSKSAVTIRAGNIVSLGQGHVFIGDLPGMRLLEQLAGGGRNNSNSNKPADVVVGLDFLKRAYRMILRVPEQEVWFEELSNDQLKWS